MKLTISSWCLRSFIGPFHGTGCNSALTPCVSTSGVLCWRCDHGHSHKFGTEKKWTENYTRKMWILKRLKNKNKNTFILSCNNTSLLVEVIDCCVLVFILFFLPLRSATNIVGVLLQKTQHELEQEKML